MFNLLPNAGLGTACAHHNTGGGQPAGLGSGAGGVVLWVLMYI